MKILVTGGAGFIASNLVDALIEKGHDVVIVDDLSSGKKENLNPKAKFYEIDIRDKKLEDVFRKEKPEIVSHHAAQIAVRVSLKDPEFDASVNIMGFLNLMQNCVKYGVKKIINVSSGGVVYKQGAKLPIPETEHVGPISPYGVAKLAAEHYLNYYSEVFGIKYTSMRYSNVYGIRQDPHGEAGVVAIFTDSLSTGEEVTIFGDGKQTRDFVFVKDVVSANLLAMEHGDNEAINIATNTQTSINELFRVIAKITDYKKKANYADAKPGEVLHSRLDISKAKKILKWQPKYSLEEGLRETIEWAKSRN